MCIESREPHTYICVHIFGPFLRESVTMILFWYLHKVLSEKEKDMGVNM